MRPGSGVFLIALASIVALASFQCAADEPRQRVPDAASLTAADKIISELYAAKLRNTSLQARWALGRQMLDEGRQMKNDPAGKYALLNRAWLLAADAGDIPTALGAVDALTEAYAVDGLGMSVESLRRLAPKMNTPDGHIQIAQRGMIAIDSLMQAGRYEEVAAVLPMVQNEAALSGDLPTKSQAVAKLGSAKRVVAEYQNLRPQFDALAKNPSNPQANAAVGKFYFANKGDGASAIPFLARGPNGDTWKDAAAKDLANPQTPGQQADVAEAWWNVAAEQKDQLKARALARAAMWYRQAEPGLKGLAKVVAQKRIAEAQAAVGVGVEKPATPPPSIAPPVEAPPVAHPHVTILSARWGGGKKWLDVTARVRDLMASDKKFWTNPSTVGGDPTPGWRKHLEITYIKNGVTKKTSVDEDHAIEPDTFGN
jgi:hypothetical protein